MAIHLLGSVWQGDTINIPKVCHALLALMRAVAMQPGHITITVLSMSLILGVEVETMGKSQG